MVDIRSKRLKRIKLQAFLMCFVSVGAVAAAGTATFAWFSTNKIATATYANIVAQDSSLVESVAYYKIQQTNTENGVTTYIFNGTGTTIPEYSRIDENEAHQLLIAITLRDNVTGCKIVAAPNSDSQILNMATSTSDTNQWSVIDWNKTPYPLSTIISFYYTETANVVDNNGSKKITITKNTSSSTTQSFISLDQNTAYPVRNGDNLSLASSTTNKVVYVVLDYDLDLIESIYSFNIGNDNFTTDAGSDSSGLIFSCDFHINVRSGS